MWHSWPSILLITHSLVLAAVLQNGSMNFRFWSAVSCEEERGWNTNCGSHQCQNTTCQKTQQHLKNIHVLHNKTTAVTQTSVTFSHLLWRHSCQFAHVEVQDVELQAAGCCAFALQELNCQQLQKPGNNTDETENTVSVVKGTPAESNLLW